MATKILFLLFGAFALHQVTLAQRKPPPPPPCECQQIVVTSDGVTKNLHAHALGSFGLSSSHFNAFKSTVYRNSKSLTLIGGANQFWRIHGGSRAGRIMIRHKSCKESCPTDCSADWEVFQRPRYVKDKNIRFECKRGNGVSFP